MSKVVSGVVVLVLLAIVLGGCFSETVAKVVCGALDFQGSSFVVAFLVLTGIFCWGNLTSEE